MKVDDWLKTAATKLEKSGISTVRLDTLVLLEDAIGKDRSWLLAHPKQHVKDETLRKLEKQIKRRAKHEPLAYIRGMTEFYGREFLINKDVLEPRPESETMIELLKNLNLQASSVILDLGTGSGALAITAKLEIPNAELVVTDINPKCLIVASQNAQKHKVKVKFFLGDLLLPVSKKVDVILANLPYVPDNFKLNDAAMNEPKLAIFGGPDGLDVYRRFFSQIATKSQKPLYVLTEALPFQHQKLAKIAAKTGYKLTRTDDFIQLFTKLA